MAFVLIGLLIGIFALVYFVPKQDTVATNRNLDSGDVNREIDTSLFETKQYGQLYVVRNSNSNYSELKLFVVKAGVNIPLEICITNISHIIPFVHFSTTRSSEQRAVTWHSACL